MEENLPVEADTLIPVKTPVTQVSVRDLEKSVEEAKKYMDLLDRIRKYSISMTNQADWVNQNGKPYLQATGSNKIAAGFGVVISDIKQKQHDYTDENGDVTEITYEGFATWNNKKTHAIGSCNTRDKFFCKTMIGGFKPRSEIDIPNIRRKAHTNFMNRAIKNLLGLAFTWDEILKYSDGKITPGGTSTVNYDKGKYKGATAIDTAEEKERRSKVRTMVLEMCGGDIEAAGAFLADLTAWTDKSGKQIAGKKKVSDLSAKQLNFIYSKIKRQFTEFEKMRDTVK